MPAPRVRLFFFITLALLATSQSSPAAQKLMLVGGGNTPTKALNRFMSWSGGTAAEVLIIPWNTDTPDDCFTDQKTQLAPYHPAAVLEAPAGATMGTPASKSQFLASLAQATGVFFCGGDQTLGMAAMADAEVVDSLRKKYDQGTPFGGTSAGTAIMSQIMITGAGDPTSLGSQATITAPGLGLLPAGVIVDQHFVKRQRENRLISLILQHRDQLGVGIDQDNALMVKDNRFAEAVGPTEIMTIEAEALSEKLIIGLLHDGEHYDLEKREKL